MRAVPVAFAPARRSRARRAARPPAGCGCSQGTRARGVPRRSNSSSPALARLAPHAAAQAHGASLPRFGPAATKRRTPPLARLGPRRRSMANGQRSAARARVGLGQQGEEQDRRRRHASILSRQWRTVAGTVIVWGPVSSLAKHPRSTGAGAPPVNGAPVLPGAPHPAAGSVGVQPTFSLLDPASAVAGSAGVAPADAGDAVSSHRQRREPGLPAGNPRS